MCRLLAVTSDHLVEVALTVVLAFGASLVAEALHVSGIIATVVAGLIIGNYGRIFSMSTKARETVGLTPGQEEELRVAVADRDRVWEEVTDVRWVFGDEGKETVTTTDAIRVAQADRDYRARVKAILDGEQHGKWLDEGFQDGVGRSRPRSQSIRFRKGQMPKIREGEPVPR